MASDTKLGPLTRTPSIGANRSENGDCPTDINDSGATDAPDLAQMLGQWGPVDPGNCLDSNNDNVINAADLAVLLGSCGPCL